MHWGLVKAIFLLPGTVLVFIPAEAILLQSCLIAVWMMVFFIGNSIYFPLIEERGLEKRFGNQYRNYKDQVPRWIPRLSPWSQESDEEQNSS